MCGFWIWVWFVIFLRRSFMLVWVFMGIWFWRFCRRVWFMIVVLIGFFWGVCFLSCCGGIVFFGSIRLKISMRLIVWCWWWLWSCLIFFFLNYVFCWRGCCRGMLIGDWVVWVEGFRRWKRVFFFVFWIGRWFFCRSIFFCWFFYEGRWMWLMFLILVFLMRRI